MQGKKRTRQDLGEVYERFSSEDVRKTISVNKLIIKLLTNFNGVLPIDSGGVKR